MRPVEHLAVVADSPSVRVGREKRNNLARFGGFPAIPAKNPFDLKGLE